MLMHMQCKRGNTNPPKHQRLCDRRAFIVWRAAPNDFLGERGPSSMPLANSWVVNCAFACRCKYTEKKSKNTQLFITAHATVGPKTRAQATTGPTARADPKAFCGDRWQGTVARKGTLFVRAYDWCKQALVAAS